MISIDKRRRVSFRQITAAIISQAYSACRVWRRGTLVSIIALSRLLNWLGSYEIITAIDIAVYRKATECLVKRPGSYKAMKAW